MDGQERTSEQWHRECFKAEKKGQVVESEKVAAVAAVHFREPTHAIQSFIHKTPDWKDFAKEAAPILKGMGDRLHFDKERAMDWEERLSIEADDRTKAAAILLREAEKAVEQMKEKGIGFNETGLRDAIKQAREAGIEAQQEQKQQQEKAQEKAREEFELGMKLSVSDGMGGRLAGSVVQLVPGVGAIMQVEAPGTPLHGHPWTVREANYRKEDGADRSHSNDAGIKPAVQEQTQEKAAEKAPEPPKQAERKFTGFSDAKRDQGRELKRDGEPER